MGHLKILVAEDSTTTRTILRRALKDLGYGEIREVDDGTKAIAAIKETRFDLVICDWHMPGASGLDVLREVRQNRFYSELPLLMLTAESETSKVVEAIELGVTDYVVKPFTAETIEEKLRKVFKDRTPTPPAVRG